jgi:hypothetical protein
MREGRIDMRILVVVVTPCTLAFTLPKHFWFSSGCVLPASRADISDRIEDHSAFRTIGEHVRRRCP